MISGVISAVWLISITVASSVRADIGPNGQIAFAFYEFCCDYDIWVMNPDGTGQVNLTNTPDISESDPSWSNDGTKIAFTRDGDIWVMNADGTGQINLTNSPENDFGADWAPDDTRLIFTRELSGQVISNQFDIFTMNADGTNQVNIYEQRF
jgi:TolB protein